MSQIRYSQLDGKDVLTQDGTEMGEIDDCVVDDESWAVVELVVKLSRDLLDDFHLKRPMFGSHTVRVPVSYVSGVGDKVILEKRLDEVTQLGQSSPAAREAPPDKPE